MLTRDELVGVMPGAAGMADKVVPALDAAMQRFDIASPARMAAFLAQLAHESGELRHWTENLNYGWQGLRKTFSKYFQTDADARAYERKPERIANRVYGGRMGNGPESSGDGWRYRGRGPIQLTGKQNYQACGTAIGVDLVNAPERLETPEVGCLAAAWFWASKGLNALADAGDFVTITKRINGGTIGLEERKAFWNRAKALFGVTRTRGGGTARGGREGRRRDSGARGETCCCCAEEAGEAPRHGQSQGGCEGRQSARRFDQEIGKESNDTEGRGRETDRNQSRETSQRCHEEGGSEIGDDSGRRREESGGEDHEAARDRGEESGNESGETARGRGNEGWTEGRQAARRSHGEARDSS